MKSSSLLIDSEYFHQQWKTIRGDTPYSVFDIITLLHKLEIITHTILITKCLFIGAKEHATYSLSDWKNANVLIREPAYPIVQCEHQSRENTIIDISLAICALPITFQDSNVVILCGGSKHYSKALSFVLKWGYDVILLSNVNADDTGDLYMIQGMRVINIMEIICADSLSDNNDISNRSMHKKRSIKKSIKKLNNIQSKENKKKCVAACKAKIAKC